MENHKIVQDGGACFDCQFILWLDFDAEGWQPVAGCDDYVTLHNWLQDGNFAGAARFTITQRVAIKVIDPEAVIYAADLEDAAKR